MKPEDVVAIGRWMFRGVGVEVDFGVGDRRVNVVGGTLVGPGSGSQGKA
jgi:hypothetical protein